MDFMETLFYMHIKLDYFTYRCPKYPNVVKATIQLGFCTLTFWKQPNTKYLYF